MTESIETTPASGFAELGLPEPLLRALAAVGYESPSPIQAATIPVLLAGRDLVGQAQTGTGKTAAFALPILARIDLNQRQPQALVLAPTRELAIQVAEAFISYAQQMPGLQVLPIYGGQSYTPQLAALRRGVHVVVGTPGRIIDHLERGTLVLDGLSHVVLDEADEMLRMGFIDDVEAILQAAPEQRQVALFSATMPTQIRRIAQRHLHEPQEITIKAKTTTAPRVQQRYWMVSGLHKLDALTRILEVEDFDAMIIFARTKKATEELAEKLAARGFAAAALNGDIPQQLRERTVQKLKDGQIDILIATDVAARGLDVERISHVVNFDIPTDTESYVHRIGRTGRAGRSGSAILFVTPRERYLLQAIERATRQPIERMQLPSTEAVNDVRISRFLQRITDAREQEGLEPFQELIERYEREHNVPALEIAAALARMVQGDKPLLLREEAERGFGEHTSPRAERAPRAERTPRAPETLPPRQPAAPRSLDQIAEAALDQLHDQVEKASAQHAERTERAERSERPPREPRQAEFDDDRRPPRRSHKTADVAFETYRVEVGRDHGVQVRNLVGAIANESGLDNQHIGNIAIRGQYSLIDLPSAMPKDVMRNLQKVWVMGQQLKLRPATEAFDQPPPRRGREGGYERRNAGQGEFKRGAPRAGSGERQGYGGERNARPAPKRKPTR